MTATASTHCACTLLAGLLAGCSTAYTPPPPSEAASLQFVNKTPLPMAVHLYDEAAQCKGRRVLSALKPQEERIVLVPGGRDVAFSIVHDVRVEHRPLIQFERIATGCLATLSFKPEQGASYVFRMDSDVYHCVYQFNEAAKVQQGLAGQVPFIKREAIRATSEAGPFCR
jgi:hypothetical protein